MVLFLAGVLTALSISFLCSLCEAVLLSLTPAQVAELDGPAAASGKGRWTQFKANVDRPIAVILLLNTAAHTIGASVAGAQFGELFGDKWLWAFSLAFTFIMLQYTELLPKSLGVRFNSAIAPRLGRVLMFLIWLLGPVIRLARLINRPFEARGTASGKPASVDEISALAGLARLSKQISAQQERIITAASRLSSLRVHEVMIPVEQMVFFSTKMTLPEAVLAAHIDAHTRFPVCQDGDPDRVVGYVNFKEMIYSLRTNPRDPSITGVTHPMEFFPPLTPVSQLLKFFVEEHEHMAIVRGESGKTMGLVTMEDIIEELIGELEDEFDKVPHYVHPLTSGMWLVGGGSPMAAVAAKIGKELPDVKGTVNGWMTAKLGRPPKAGDAVRIGGCEFLVRRTRRGKVFEASINTSVPEAVGL